MSLVTENQSAYRCIVPEEHSSAVLQINRRRVKCIVQNTSRDGFSIQLDQRFEEAARGAKRLILRFSDESWTVCIVSIFCEGDGNTVLGLRRVTELTELRRSTGRSGTLQPKFSPQTDTSFLLTLLIAFIIVSLCTPGVGDSLGTAEVFRTWFDSVLNYLRQAIP